MSLLCKEFVHEFAVKTGANCEMKCSEPICNRDERDGCLSIHTRTWDASARKITICIGPHDPASKLHRKSLAGTRDSPRDDNLFHFFLI